MDEGNDDQVEPVELITFGSTFNSFSWQSDGSTVIEHGNDGHTHRELHGEQVAPISADLMIKKIWDNHSIDLVDPLGQWEISLPTQEVSGCYHIRSYSNGAAAGLEYDEERSNYLHVCEVDDFIAMLQEARDLRDAFVRGESIPECDHPFRTTITDDGVVTLSACPACGFGRTDRSSSGE